MNYINLSEFNEPDVKDYLRQNMKIGTENEFDALIKEICTTSMSSAGLYILPKKLSLVLGAFRGSITETIDSYIKTYRNKKIDGETYPEFEIVLGTLFDKKTLDIRNIDNHNAPWNILQYCVFLDPDFIPIDVFTKLGFARRDIDNGINFLKLLGLLEELNQNFDSGSMRGIKLHRITQDVVMDYQNNHESLNQDKHLFPSIMVRNLLLVFQDIFPKVNEQSNKNKQKAKLLINSVIRLFNKFEFWDLQVYEREKIAKLFHEAGEYCMITQKYDSAMSFHDQALNLLKISYPDEQHLDIATALTYQGRTYSSMKYWDSKYLSREQALKLSIEKHSRALDIRRKLSDINNEMIASSLGNIGCNYFYLGEYELAKSNIYESVEIYIKLYPEEHFKKLVEDYKNQHQSTDMLSEYHVHFAAMINTLGSTYLRLAIKKSSKDVGLECAKIALKYRILSLKMRIDLYGDIDEASIALSLCAIGESYSILKDFDQSLKYMLESLQMRKRLSYDHTVKWLH